MLKSRTLLGIVAPGKAAFFSNGGKIMKGKLLALLAIGAISLATLLACDNPTNGQKPGNGYENGNGPGTDPGTTPDPNPGNDNGQPTPDPVPDPNCPQRIRESARIEQMAEITRRSAAEDSERILAEMYARVNDPSTVWNVSDLGAVVRTQHAVEILEGFRNLPHGAHWAASGRIILEQCRVTFKVMTIMLDADAMRVRRNHTPIALGSTIWSYWPENPFNDDEPLRSAKRFILGSSHVLNGPGEGDCICPIPGMRGVARW